MAVLYRKYRPQTFAEVLNQKSIIQTLKNQVAGGSVAHAYLFTGSRGVGKTSAARILAKAVNCTNSAKGEGLRTKGDACGECDICKAVEAGNFLDLVEIDAASNTGVENVRELIEHVKFSPSLGKYKVFIIDEVHMLSKAAFNALLKTLEEPPRHTIFILATTEINKVPATIVSRTQRFDFKALSAGDLLEHLQQISQKEGLKFASEILELIAQNAEGSVRDALSLLDKLMTLGDQASLEDSQQLLGITDTAVCENLLGLIVGGKPQALPEFFTELLEKGLDFKILNRDFLEYLRKCLIYKIVQKQQNSGLSEHHQAKLKTMTSSLSVNDLVFFTRLFLRSYKDLDSSPGPEIPLLLAAVEAALKKSVVSDQSSVISKQPELGIINEKLETFPKSAPLTSSESIESAEAAETNEIISTHAHTDNTGKTISLSEITDAWPKVLNKIKTINGPLASMLRAASLQSLEQGKLVLGVKFLFDKQNLENTKNANLICNTVEQLLGKKVYISAQVTKEVKIETSDPSLVVAEALKVFGGELIE